MSVCAIMRVKDEADIIEATIRHLADQVDAIHVADNDSSDGTYELLARLVRDGFVQSLSGDNRKGYYQSNYMTEMAHEARRAGHEWVVPVDADEIWYVGTMDATISEFLDGHPANIVTAELYDHVVTGADDRKVDDPVRRIGWRRRECGGLPKVAALLLPGLVIEMGNHGAHYPGLVAAAPGLVVRHFPYRSEEQFIRKVRNGAAAYAATGLPEHYGQHWREYGRLNDDQLREVYETWFRVESPQHDEALIFDPAPVR